MLAYRRYQFTFKKLITPFRNNKRIVLLKFRHTLGNGLGFPGTSRRVHHNFSLTGVYYRDIPDFGFGRQCRIFNKIRNKQGIRHRLVGKKFNSRLFYF